MSPKRVPWFHGLNPEREFQMICDGSQGMMQSKFDFFKGEMYKDQFDTSNTYHKLNEESSIWDWVRDERFGYEV